MRIQTIACAAIYVIGAGCSAELAERPPEKDPGSAAAAEAPFRRTPSYEADPLLSPVPPKSPEPPPAGPQVHSPTATPPGNPPLREQPGGKPAEPAAVYTCPMHPEVRSPRPGKCPKCGMTLVVKKEK